MAAIGVVDMVSSTIATRGERLVLTRTLFVGDMGEVEALTLYEFAADGRWCGGTLHDPDDLEAAFAELDARYAAMTETPRAADLTPAHAEVWRVTERLIERYNARDRENLRALFADDAVIVDERLTGWGTLAPDAFAENLQQLIAMAPDATLSCVEIHRIETTGSVARFRVGGTVPGGGTFEMQFETVSLVRDGKLVRLDLLPEGQVEEAVRRLTQP
jgi:ketosteroid isomerase-like protein